MRTVCAIISAPITQMNVKTLMVTVVPAVAIAYLVYLYAAPPWTPPRVAGVILIGVGLLFWTIARIQLGNSFSIAPEARQLVTHGLYSRIRNPVYIFGSIAILGIILCLNRPYFLLVFLVVIPLQIVRARAESRVLENHFGDQYRLYKSHTWF